MPPTSASPPAASSARSCCSPRRPAINAVLRLFAAIAEGDAERASAELHPRVVVERPHEGARHTGRAAYLEPYAGLPVEVLRTVSEGRQVAVDARAGDWAVAGFFTLHDGRVLHATEYWVRRPG